MSEGYKGDYLEDPEKHYAKITAQRSKKRSWAWLAKNLYKGKVTGQALSAWYRGYASKLAKEEEESAIEKLARLDSGRLAENGNTDDDSNEENKRPYLQDGRWYYGDRPLAYAAYGKIEPTDKRIISRKQFDRMKIIPLAKKIDRWIKDHFPLYSWEPSPKYIIEIIVVVIRSLRSGKPTLILEPRDHGKTTVLLGMFLWWLVDQKRTLFIITSQAKKTDLFRALHDAMVSEKVRVEYGDFISSKDQTQRHIYFKYQFQRFHHDPFLMIATLDGGYIGKHSEWMHMEDPIQEPAVSEATNQKRVDNYSSGIEDISRYKSASGTRKDTRDYYHYIIEFGFRVLHRRSVEFLEGDFPRAADFIWEVQMYQSQERRFAIGLKDSYLNAVKYRTLGCPNYSFERLMIRYIRNPHSFFSQMQNEPRPKSGIKFDPNDIKVIPPFTRGELKNTLIMVGDPSFGMSGKGSDWAISVAAWYAGWWIIVDIMRGDQGLNQFVREFLRMARFWKPKYAYGENDFAQLTSRQTEYQELLQIPQFDTFSNKGYGDKLDRIEMLVPPLHRQEVKIYSTATDLEAFFDQIRRFNGKKGKWDLLDVCQSNYRISNQDADNDFFFWQSGTNTR